MTLIFALVLALLVPTNVGLAMWNLRLGNRFVGGFCIGGAVVSAIAYAGLVFA